MKKLIVLIALAGMVACTKSHDAPIPSPAPTPPSHYAGPSLEDIRGRWWYAPNGDTTRPSNSIDCAGDSFTLISYGYNWGLFTSYDTVGDTISVRWGRTHFTTNNHFTRQRWWWLYYKEGDSIKSHQRWQEDYGVMPGGVEANADSVVVVNYEELKGFRAR